MNKLLILLFIFFHTINICELSANTNVTSVQKLSKREIISLDGDLEASTRSLYPIIVMQTDDCLEIHFCDDNLGQISIIISDCNNLVYKKYESSQSHTLSNLKNGSYIIKFINNQGEYLYGQFVIENNLL